MLVTITMELDVCVTSDKQTIRSTTDEVILSKISSEVGTNIHNMYIDEIKIKTLKIT